MEMSQIKRNHEPTLHEIVNFIRKYANSDAATEVSEQSLDETFNFFCSPRVSYQKTESLLKV